MSTATLVTVEEYLRMTEKPYREYRHGVLYPKPMPTSIHGVLEFMLALLLHRQGLQAGCEISLMMSSDKVLIPDVIAAQTLEQPYPTRPVMLCCEILSPKDRLVATLAKCEEYHEWGVPFCWVIDPEKRSAWEYHAGADPVHVTDALHAGEIVVHLTELFAALQA